MVHAIADLGRRIESAGFDERLQELDETLTTTWLEQKRDRAEAAVCQLVVGTWACIRREGEAPEQLIIDLANRHYAMTMQASFERAVLEGARIVGVTTTQNSV